MPKQVFISHSANDRTAAEEICRLLEEQGIPCWIAPRDLTPGRDFGSEIIDAIETTHAMVLVLSEHANESLHVKNEVERAVSKGRTVFPVRIREVQPSKALELFIAAAHWVDAWTPPLGAKIDRLAAAIRSLSPRGGDPLPGGDAQGGRVETQRGRGQPPFGSQMGASPDRTPPPQPIVRAPLPGRLTLVPGRQIRTGCSVLETVMDREAGEMRLVKRIPRDRVLPPMTAFAHTVVDGPGIATPILQWEDDDAYNELLPMVDGWTFAEIMSLNPGIFGEYLTLWCRALLGLLTTLQEHDPPLIHRDIKPENVMVRRENLSSLVLIDCTTMIPHPAPEDVAIQGTPGYAAPEALAGAPGLASDVYSAGCTIYNWNRGERPPSPAEMEHFGRAMAPINAEDEVAGIFPWMIAVDLADRFPDAASALHAMARPTGITMKYRAFDDLVLPDGRRLKQGGFFSS